MNALTTSRAVHAAILIVIAAFLIARALFAPDNHDEAQYVATAVLSGEGWLVFRDFTSLQSPVHGFVYALIGKAAPGAVFLAMRLATVLTGIATLLLVYATLRRIGATARATLFATLALAGCAAFQYTAGIVRNDMLATFFLAAAIWILLARRGWFGFALLIGLATATKLSFVPFLLAGGVLVLREDHRAIARFAAGAVLGLAPLLVPVALAPEQAWYGMVEFGALAPLHWYGANGLADEIGLLPKLADTLKSAVRGPALLALIVICLVRRRPGFETRALVALTIAGLAGALIPTPTHLPYIMPLLLPLMILFGLAFDAIERRRLRTAVVIATALFAVIGTSRATFLIDGRARHADALAITTQTRWIAARLRESGASGAIVTLSPHRAAGSGLILDRRFATGPFVYRSGVLLTPDRAERLHVVTPVTLAGQLDRAPPAAILTGYERRSRKFTIDPDAGLVRYATTRGYRRLALPDGIGSLYLRR